VSGSNDKTIRIWDARSGAADEVFPPLSGHEGRISSVAFSPDGKHIVSGSSDSTIRIWDAASLKKYVSSSMTRAQELCVHSMAFSPDGARIACGVGHTITLWDTTSGAQILQLRGHQSPVSSLIFSPNAQYIASGSEDKTVRVWDAQTGSAIHEPLQGHQHPVTSMAYSPDGCCIVSASKDHVIRVWNASSGTMVFPAIRGHTNWVPSVALHLNPARITAALKGDILCTSELATPYTLGSVADATAIQLDIFVPRHVGTGWIVDMKAHKENISKLPPSISINTVTNSASSRRSIAIGTRSGQVVIMHFPPVIWQDLGD
jgi:WD40 repeat protein